MLRYIYRSIPSTRWIIIDVCDTLAKSETFRLSIIIHVYVLFSAHDRWTSIYLMGLEFFFFFNFISRLGLWELKAFIVSLYWGDVSIY